jgi:hypothetical protein
VLGTMSKGDSSKKSVTQGTRGNVSGNGNLWLKITAFGGGADLKLFFAKVQNRPKVMAKIIKNYVRNIFSKTLYVPYLNQKCSDFVQMLCKGLL